VGASFTLLADGIAYVVPAWIGLTKKKDAERGL